MEKIKMEKPRPNTLVRVDYVGGNTDPFTEGEVLLYLGEIENMPDHCTVVNRAGIVLWGYHTDRFVELLEDET